MPGGEERAVPDDAPVHVRVRTDEHVVAELDRMRLAAAHERVLHDHAAGADLDVAVFAAHHGPEEDARVRPDSNVAAQHRGGRHVGAGVDGRPLPSMLDEHVRSVV